MPSERAADQREGDAVFVARDDLRRLAEAATPGPWAFDGHAGVWRGTTPDLDQQDKVLLAHLHPERHADGPFMAAANPTMVLALLDELDRLNRVVAEHDIARESGRCDGLLADA